MTGHQCQKISDYIVIASNDRNTLSKLIREWSEAGYLLWGSPFVNKQDEYLREDICQTMVKYDG